MAHHEFIPTLSQYDIEHAAQLIQQAYSPPSSSTTTPDDLKRLQHDLFEIQKRHEAWGLVIPLLNHEDQNVQFFGAHTAQVKIARDWSSFPQEHAESLRDLMLQLTAHLIAVGRTKVILRKLYVALTSLALKLAPGHPTRWPEWIFSCVSAFSNQGASAEYILDFLTIVPEEIGSADLVGPKLFDRAQMYQSMTNGSELVMQAITSTVSSPPGTLSINQYLSALRCFQAWMSFLRADDITPLIPLAISLLDPNFPDDSIFVAASDALQDIMSKSSMLFGTGSKTITEPLLMWFQTYGNRIIESTLATGEISAIAHSLCKLVVALGEHSIRYIASNISSIIPIVDLASSTTAPGPPIKGHLVQNFLRLLLAFTGLPGYYGVDEEESEMTLGFWYTFQEALWSSDFREVDDNSSADDASLGYASERNSPIEAVDKNDESSAAKQVIMSKAVFSGLVPVLRRKVAFPPPGSGWSKDQVEKFQVYRRDIGDTLINAYYVLRDDLIAYFVNDILERLAARQEGDGWQEVEASLHCLMSIQEAVDMESVQHLDRLFGDEILGKLPATGRSRIRRTTLGLIGSYSSWFAFQPQPPSASPMSMTLTTASHGLLLNVLTYVVAALNDPSLSLSSATALRNLCEANKKQLAPHIGAFGGLHAGLGDVPDSEKGKVLQSIASVVQAVPPAEQIPTIEAIVNPIVQKLYDALQSASTLPEEARVTTVLQLEILAGVAKGLTRMVEGLSILEDDTDPDAIAEAEALKQARVDPRMEKLRGDVYAAIKGVVEVWSTDASIGLALSDLFKAITCLPADLTLLSLPGGPLLELICLVAMQRQMTASWLSIAAILISQLSPAIYSVHFRINVGSWSNDPGDAEARALAAAEAVRAAEAVVQRLLPVILQVSLTAFNEEGAMEAHPDIVQEFFSCMDRVAQEFTGSFYTLPPPILQALIQCSTKALSLQERYSLVSACNFISTLIHKSSLLEELEAHKTVFLAKYGREIMRAVLLGFAGVAPRSAVPNLIEMLGTLVTRADTSSTPAASSLGGDAGLWIKEILFSDDFLVSRANNEAKTKFLKEVTGSRSLRKFRDAANQFTLVARGLEGSNFGYSSVTM